MCMPNRQWKLFAMRFVISIRNSILRENRGRLITQHVFLECVFFWKQFLLASPIQRFRELLGLGLASFSTLFCVLANNRGIFIWSFLAKKAFNPYHFKHWFNVISFCHFVLQREGKRDRHRNY